MLKNAANQSLSFLVLDANLAPVTTGTPTAITVAKDNAAPATALGTLAPVGGYWRYLPTQAETDCDTFVLYAEIPNSATPILIEVKTDSTQAAAEAALANYQAATIANQAALSAALITIDDIVDQILVDTGTDLPTAIGNISGGGGITEQGVRDALGYTSANHDAQVTALTDLINLIKGKTDQLVFVNGLLNSNIKAINDGGIASAQFLLQIDGKQYIRAVSNE